jgi:hypothetical protein
MFKDADSLLCESFLIVKVELFTVRADLKFSLKKIQLVNVVPSVVDLEK